MIYALKPGHTLIVDTDSFNKKNLEKAEYTTNPLEDGSLENYKVIEVDMTSLTKTALKDVAGLDTKTISRSKNMFSNAKTSFFRVFAEICVSRDAWE